MTPIVAWEMQYVLQDEDCRGCCSTKEDCEARGDDMAQEEEDRGDEARGEDCEGRGDDEAKADTS